MEYIILIHGDESYAMPGPGDPGFDEMMAGWSAFNQQLIDGGHWISGAMLAPTTTATTLVKSYDGSSSLLDGPFAETKEQLGGFYLVSANDLDEVVELAKALPVPVGSLEIRPIALRPDAA